MKFYKATEMQSIDQEAISKGTSGEVLMSRACRKLAGELLFFSGGTPRPIVILCGPGNNGGDGFGMALHLHTQGWPVEIWLTVPEENVKGDAGLFYMRAKESGVWIRDVSELSAWERAELFLQPGAWLVDALLGTGSHEAPRGVLASAVGFLRKHHRHHLIWSVDLPTGLDADSGLPFNDDLCVIADYTLTLGAAKTGFALDPSGKWTGSVSVLDLGFSKELMSVHGSQSSPFCLSDHEASELLPDVSRSSHKGSRGHLLLVGGSPGMTGSITLSAKAATMSGCGLVTVLSPFSCAQVVDAAVPEAMVLPGKQGKFLSLSAQSIPFSNYQAIGVGPGMRTNFDCIELVARILTECQTPLLFDADALNCMAMLEPDHQRFSAPMWMTPHPGEMARLMKCSLDQVSQNRRETVASAAKTFGARMLLKGDHSRMADAEGVEWVNLNGNPGMAKGGSGDVLTGLLGGLLAQGVDSENVLPLAVYLHGRAGDLAACRIGNSGMKAGDIVDAIPAVLHHLKGR